MNYFKFLIIALLIVVGSLQSQEVFGQDADKHEFKIKYKYLLGSYNRKAAYELNYFLRAKQTIMQFRMAGLKMSLPDTINNGIINFKSDAKVYLIVSDSIRWEMSETPKYPDLINNKKNKDYDPFKDPEVISWLHYMLSVDYWKEYNNIPLELVDGYYSVDTVEYESSKRLVIECFCKPKEDGTTDCSERLIPLD